MPHHIWLQKRIEACLCVLGLGCVASSAALQSHYAKILPRHTQPELDRTQPLNVHGRVIYLTEREDAELGWLFFGGMFVAALGGIATIVEKKKT